MRVPTATDCESCFTRRGVWYFWETMGAEITLCGKCVAEVRKSGDKVTKIDL